jgi:two-component system chemotaxis sensor kinase CheA
MSAKSTLPQVHIEEMQELVNDFIHESMANLERNEQLVESLGSDDVWLIEQNIRILFRTFHSIKGVAGFLQFAVLQALTHETETLFDSIRKRPVRQNYEVLQAIYQAFDGIRYIIREVEKHGTDTTARAKADAVITHVQKFIAPNERIDLDGNILLASVRPPAQTPSKQSLSSLQATAPLLNLLLPSDIAGIRDKTAMLIAAVHNLVLTEEIDANNSSAQDLSAQDSSAEMQRIEAARERISHIHLLIGEIIEHSQLPQESEAVLVGQGAFVFSDMMASGDLVLNDITLLTLQSQVNNFVEALGVHLQESLKEKPAQQSIAIAVESSINQTPTLREDDLLIKTPHHLQANEQNVLLQQMNVSYQHVPNDDTTHQSIDRHTTDSNGHDQNGHDQNGMQGEVATIFGGATYTDRSEIRVETVKLDRLFDLMSELVTLQTMTLNNPDLHDLDLPNFQKSATMLAKNIRQLQGVTMSMRMTPIEILFAKMKRITREVSAQLGKRVELKMSGADTEMDKTVIELLFDPLVHILRNAIDHGIEAVEERERVGKSATGVIHLSALYEGNEILISVRDDGGGLNRTRILQRAIERGIAPQNAEALTDEEVWNFIFEPGFSTAETVTDVSGRGVGMDVVKQNIGKMRGSVQVRSREGKGSTITLRIPLTLASMDVILVRVGETHYAIPIGSVRQSFRPEPEDITTTMDGLEVVRVRETLYTIVRLHELFQQRTDNAAIEQGILVIVEANARTVCLFVDEIVGQQQTVIKPLAKYIGEVRGLNGCMILSDGTIGLILDVEELIRFAEEPEAELA